MNTESKTTNTDSDLIYVECNKVSVRSMYPNLTFRYDKREPGVNTFVFNKESNQYEFHYGSSNLILKGDSIHKLAKSMMQHVTKSKY